MSVIESRIYHLKSREGSITFFKIPINFNETYIMVNNNTSLAINTDHCVLAHNEYLKLSLQGVDYDEELDSNYVFHCCGEAR
jgi:hypothetical protein